MHKMESLPEVNDQVLIPRLKIPKSTTTSVNTSAILAQPILDDNTPVLKPTKKFIAESNQKIKDCWNWLLDYITPKLKVVDKALESFKNQIENCTTRRHFLPIERVKIWVEKVCDTVSNRWKRLD